METIEVMGYIFGIIFLIFIGIGIATLLSSFVEYVSDTISRIFSK
jgi:hypothetical protein